MENNTNINIFGDSAKYYSSRNNPNRNLSNFERDLEKLLEQAYPDLSGSVQRAIDNWNLKIRAQIKKETALVLSEGDDITAIPIRNKPGLPAPLLDLLRSKQPFPLELVLNLNVLKDTNLGLIKVTEQYDIISKMLSDINNSELPTKVDIRKTRQLVKDLVTLLDKIDLSKEFTNFNEDVLGAYYFNIPEITIHYLAIGLFARLKSISIEALTAVVLCHELCHAYTHLGKDTEREIWETSFFAKTEDNIVEGLAQYYTHIICNKLTKKYPEVSKAYRILLDSQGGPYLVHLDWINKYKVDGEIIRAGLIETRRKNLTLYKDFQEHVLKAKDRIGKVAKSKGLFCF